MATPPAQSDITELCAAIDAWVDRYPAPDYRTAASEALSLLTRARIILAEKR